MKGDNWIWGIYWILIIVSIVEMASATSRLTWRTETNDNPLYDHTSNLVAGFFACVFLFENLISKRTGWIKAIGIIAYVLGVVLMAALPLFGREVNGAKRDIFHIQPVELCKLGLVLVLCFIVTIKNADLQRMFGFLRYKTDKRKFFIIAAIIGAAVLPVAIQNLSSALILCFVSAGILLLAGNTKIKYLVNTLLFALVIGGVGISMLYGLHSYHISNHESLSLPSFAKRAHTWENRIFDGDPTPLWEQTTNDDNMQVMYAHMAIANSNGMGTFIGNSVMRDHLPEAYSDYIYAIIFEETGIIGALFVMILYFVLFFRCYYLSLQTDDPFKRLVLVALPLLIIIQALIHMGVCTDAMFVTGQPLPLISRGGMSIFGTSACFGILFGLTANIQREQMKRNE